MAPDDAVVDDRSKMTLTELARWSFTSLAGACASSYEVQIILAASGRTAIVGSVTIAPFEAVRIPSVAQPYFTATIVDVSNGRVCYTKVEDRIELAC